MLDGDLLNLGLVLEYAEDRERGAAVSRLGRGSLHYSFQRRLRFLCQPSFMIACGEILEELDRRELGSISSLRGPAPARIVGAGNVRENKSLPAPASWSPRVARPTPPALDSKRPASNWTGGAISRSTTEAHARGLIHRDIKPGNVMICERGGIHDVAKLLDFGLVLPPAGDADGDKLTQDGTVTGTPAYLSPEQAGGQEAVDARSDICSGGARADLLLTGLPPCAGRTGMKLIAAHLYEVPEPLSRRRPDVPADLEAVILRCLAKEPAKRFLDVESLDRALAACLMGLGVECDGQAGRTKAQHLTPAAASVSGNS